MWEGSYPSRTRESVFSWEVVAGWTAQLIDKKEYFIQTDIPQLPTQESQQMSLFDFAAFQQPARTEGAAQPSVFSHPALPQQVIDEALCIGSNHKHSRLIICAYFKKDKPDNARFLAEHYGENGAGFYLDGRQYAIWYNAEGIRIAQGESAQRSSATLILWEQAAARIRELLDLGRYMPQSELDRVDGYERQQRAAQLWYLRQDFAEGTADAGYLPTVNSGKYFLPAGVGVSDCKQPDESRSARDLRNGAVPCFCTGDFQHSGRHYPAPAPDTKGGPVMKHLKWIIPVLIIVFCFLGFLIAPHNPEAMDIANKYAPFSAEFPLGTDQFGRCELSRLLYGGYVTLGIVLLGGGIVLVLGTLIGLWLGRANAARSLVFSSLLDAVTAIPPLAYLIIFVGIWGNSIPTMLVALTVSLILRMIKLVKTQTEIELDKAYVLCAVSSGASRSRVLFVHILPNIIRPLVHFLCLSCAEMIMNISAFSFIGLTLGDDVIDWGSMLSEGRSMLMTHPSLLFLPILFIFLCTLAFNLLAKQLEGGDAA